MNDNQNTNCDDEHIKTDDMSCVVCSVMKSPNKLSARSIASTSRYYIFDWDDNILRMPTKVCYETLQDDGSWQFVQLSTSEHRSARKQPEKFRAPGNDISKQFVEFADFGPRGTNAFVEDAKAALDSIEQGQVSPPSFSKFRVCLIEGRLFAIVTARGHAPETLRRGVKLFYERVLSDEERAVTIANLRKFKSVFDKVDSAHDESDEAVLEAYFDMCSFNGVTSPAFFKQHGLVKRENQQNIERSKKLAIQAFVKYVVKFSDSNPKLSVSIGFSDDDAGNVKHVRQFLAEELALEHENVKFVIYDTSSGTTAEKEVIQTPNMEEKKKKKRKLLLEQQQEQHQEKNSN